MALKSLGEQKMKSRRSPLSVAARKTIDARGKLFKEGRTWHAECPELDCGGRGRTIRQAIAGFEKSLRFHFEEGQ